LPLTEEQIKHYGGSALKSLGKVKPTLDEIKYNPRSRSAILRIAKRV